MKRLIALFAFLSAILTTSYCYAATGSVRGLYEYDGETIDGVHVELYKVADFENGFEFMEAYVGLERDIGNMTNSELGEYGVELAKIEAAPLAESQTIAGEYGFTGLSEGIYLVKFEDKKVGDYTYLASPIVLTMPDKNLSYQIELTTKLEKSCPDCIEPEPPRPKPAPENEPEPDNSEQVNTLDQIRTYIWIFIGLIIIETLMLHVIIKERKRGQNEEQ